MKNYILEKYKGWSSRYTCPKCGRSHCFTRYIDTWTGQYLADDVGMCDHKKNCGYHKPPRMVKPYFLRLIFKDVAGPLKSWRMTKTDIV